jgi:hypothetical protein
MELVSPGALTQEQREPSNVRKECAGANDRSSGRRLFAKERREKAHRDYSETSRTAGREVLRSFQNAPAGDSKEAD